jgi:hypothetical protein
MISRSASEFDADHIPVAVPSKNWICTLLINNVFVEVLQTHIVRRDAY